MRRCTAHLVFGFLLGLAAAYALPGHHPGGWAAAAVSSVLGAAAGRILAQWVLPKDLIAQAGFVLAGMGAVAALLLQGVAIR